MKTINQLKTDDTLHLEQNNTCKDVIWTIKKVTIHTDRHASIAVKGRRICIGTKGNGDRMYIDKLFSIRADEAGVPHSVSSSGTNVWYRVSEIKEAK